MKAPDPRAARSRAGPRAEPERYNPLMSRWFLGFAALGLAASSASTWVHYRLLTDPTYTSVCDVNSTFSCSQAYTSQYGSLAGVPVAEVAVELVFTALRRRVPVGV